MYKNLVGPRSTMYRPRYLDNNQDNQDYGSACKMVRKYGSHKILRVSK